ncbi:MAG TPA: hypothetical protein DCR74_05005 [Achromobacter sp.]|nr:hypothetical protein [Achromobacter sp.]
MSLRFLAGPTPSRKRLILIAAALALALLIGVAVWLAGNKGPAAPPPPNYGKLPVAVSVAAARTGPLQRDLHALGTITPLAQVTVRSQVDGELIKLHYTEGQAVAQGQLLAEIDPRPFQTALASAEGELAQTQALLGRISQEGWAQRRPGYGWEFSSMMTTPDSLLQSYRLRLALEPAALREPGFRIEKSVLARCRAAEMHLLDGGIATDTADQLHDRGVRFHESLVEASGNPFFIDTIKRVNRVRRLLSYRSMQDRSRYQQHCDQHLAILDLLERERNDEAADALSAHLRSTLDNLARISGILTS